jgi:hypothetical protein
MLSPVALDAQPVPEATVFGFGPVTLLLLNGTAVWTFRLPLLTQT